MNSVASCSTESDTCVVAAQYEIIHDFQSVFRSVLDHLLESAHDQFDGSSADHSGQVSVTASNITFCCMDQSVDGAVHERLIRKALNQIRNQHSIICEQFIIGTTFFGFGLCQIDHGNVGYFTSCTAGGGADDQFSFMFRFESRVLFVCVYDVIRFFRCYPFCHIDNSTAADSDDSLILFISQIFEDRIVHFIGRLCRAVFLLEINVTFQIERFHFRSIQKLVGEQQVALTDFKFFCKIFKGVKFVNVCFQ